MLDKLEVREPPKQTWVSLTAALTWIEYEHSLEVDHLLQMIKGDYKEQKKVLRLRLQEVWQRLADLASIGHIEIRGRVLGDRVERTLNYEELRNNRFLAWVAQPGSNIDVRVERHDGTGDNFDGEWERLSDRRSVDLHEVVVRRDELLRFHPVPRKSVRRLRVSKAEADRAGEWLKDQLEARVVKSMTKRELLRELRSQFNVSASQAQQLWREATRSHPGWSVPGPRRKIVSV
jgi:hypothetical protein